MQSANVTAVGFSEKARENWVRTHDLAIDQLKNFGFDVGSYKIEVFGQIFGQGAQLPINKSEQEPTAPSFSAPGFAKGMDGVTIA